MLQMRYFRTSGDFFNGQGCTLSQMYGNVEKFLGEGNWREGGWSMWHEMTLNPSDNIYGSYFAADAELSFRVANAKGETLTQLNWGDGVNSWCGESDVGGDAEKINDGKLCTLGSGDPFVINASKTPLSCSSDPIALKKENVCTSGGKLVRIDQNRTVSCSSDAIALAGYSFCFTDTGPKLLTIQDQDVVTCSSVASATQKPVCADKNGNPGKVSTPGSVIADKLKFNANSSLRQLELADSIDQVINAVLQRAFFDVKNLAGASKPKSGGSSGNPPPTSIDVTGLSPDKAKDELIRGTEEQIASLKEFLTNVSRIQKRALQATNDILSFSTSYKKKSWGRTNYGWTRSFNFTEADLPKPDAPLNSNSQLFAYDIFDQYGKATNATTSVMTNLLTASYGRGRPIGDFCKPAVELAFMYDIQPTLKKAGEQKPRADKALTELLSLKEEIIFAHKAAKAGEQATGNLDLLETETGGGITEEELAVITNKIRQTLTDDQWKQLATRYYNTTSILVAVTGVQSGDIWEKLARKYEAIIREPYMPTSNEISEAIQDSIDQRTEGSYTVYGLMSYYIDIATRDYAGKACGRMVENPDAIGRIIEDNNLADRLSSQIDTLLSDAAAEAAESGDDEQDTTTVIGNPSVSVKINGDTVSPENPESEGALTATIGEVLYGSSLTFEWSSENTVYCKISAPDKLSLSSGASWPTDDQALGTSGTVNAYVTAPSGSNAKASYAITTTCYKDSSIYDQFVVTIPVVQPPPVVAINGATGAVPALRYQSQFRLSWDAAGATSCRAEGSRVPQVAATSAWPLSGSLQPSGSVDLLAKDFQETEDPENPPAAPSSLTFGFTCEGPVGSANTSVSVPILP